jgi:sirohydrochlorin ferrochelatase
VDASNLALLEVADLFRASLDHPIVLPAHMELAEPSIADAVAQCAAMGAKRIVMVPFFLLPGRHWRKDIPQLTADACKEVGNLPFLVTSPLGVAQGVVDVLAGRMQSCLRLAELDQAGCELCGPESGCWKHDKALG